MIKMIFKYKDGSSDWASYFDTQAEADLFEAQERSRHYWKPDTEVVRIETLPTPIDPAVAAAVKAKKDAAFLSLVAFDKTKMKASDVAELIDSILIHIGIK